jgi:hypothetical protein
MRHLTLINKIKIWCIRAHVHKENKVLTYMGMQDKERIARIGSVDPGSHLGIPFSHVSANNFKI